LSAITSDEILSGELGARSIWAGFNRSFAVAFAAVLLGIFSLLVLFDPYDTGRFLHLPLRPGVSPQGPNTANASRGRDPAFGAAIFGNSTVQALRPTVLTRATGVETVSLIVPGSGPAEQLAVADWFVRNRRRPRALIFGMDGSWCTADPSLRGPYPFPFWLYARSPLEYLAGLFRFDVLERLPRRIGYLLGQRERAVPNGYWDYEIDYRAINYEAGAREKLMQVGPAGPVNTTGRFPAAAALRAFLGAVPPETVVILLRPPVFMTGLPQPGTPYARSEAGCRQAFAEIAAERPRTAIIDWRTDRPETRSAENFFDQVHYRKPMAGMLEDEIASTFAALHGN
jgi:hypothetical protein